MQTDDTAAPGPWLGAEGAAPPEVSAPAAARQARAADPAEIRAALGFYGTCIVKREGEIASKTVLSGEFLDTRSDEGKRLVQKECLADRVTVARFPDAARGELSFGSCSSSCPTSAWSPSRTPRPARS